MREPDEAVDRATQWYCWDLVTFDLENNLAVQYLSFVHGRSGPSCVVQLDCRCSRLPTVRQVAIASIYWAHDISLKADVA